MSNRKNRIIVLVLTFIFSLACNRVVTNLAGPQGPVEALPQYADPIEKNPNADGAINSQERVTPQAGTAISNEKICEATQYLQVTSEIAHQETNQYGTRMCEYNLTIKNTDENAGIWVYFYQHDKDGYARTEKSHWMGNVLIASNEEANWSGNIYIYEDKDADGPVMSIPEKIAGVYNIPECAEEKQDSNFFEMISIPIEMICPME